MILWVHGCKTDPLRSRKWLRIQTPCKHPKDPTLVCKLTFFHRFFSHCFHLPTHLPPQVVLRKAIKEEPWESAFLRSAPPADVTAERSEAVALGLACEPPAPPAAPAAAAPAAVAAEGAAPAKAAGEGVEGGATVEDSAELDVAQPLVQDSTAGALPQVDASSAVQSAMVMGQSVLLQNRLMYQLLFLGLRFSFRKSTKQSKAFPPMQCGTPHPKCTI